MNSIEEVNRSVLNENIDITQQIEGVSSGTITLPESSYKTDELNKITLELFMNKTNYVKYLSKNDPKKFEEHNKLLSNINKYRRNIIQMTDELLQNPNKQITTEVNDVFEIYVKTLIHHFQQKEYENTPDNNEFEKEDDADVLFGKMDEEQAPSMQSFWGKERIVKKPQSQLEYDIQLFSRSRFK